MNDFGLGFLTLRRLKLEAAQVEERALQLSNIGEHRLKEALAESRAAIRRAGGFLGAAKSPARAQALAVMSVVCERELGLRPTLTQIATSLALHEGHVVELDAGEARALPNALAAILFSWGGSPCHVVHSNDYQAGRDAAAMQALFDACECSSGALHHETPPERTAEFYGLDILYVASRQLLSDSVRDLLLSGVSGKLRRRLWEMRTPRGERRPVMRGTFVAIVDDAGAVLVDEATSPLVISAPGTNSVLEEATRAAHALIVDFESGKDYRLTTEPHTSFEFTPDGEHKLELKATELPEFWREGKRRTDAVTMALIARDVMKRDRHYAVREQRVILIDDNIQRLSPGYAWHYGMLQAIEVREGLPVSMPPRTIARTAFQEFFPRYERLSAVGCELGDLSREIGETYGLRLLRLCGPKSRHIRILREYRFLNREGKIQALIGAVGQTYRERGAVLVITQRAGDSVEIVERLSNTGIECHLLEGRDPAADAQRLVAARQPGTVTVATGSSGRIVDIARPDLIDASPGILVLMFEHFDLGRADRQFFDWASRQGLSGDIHVFASLEDAALGKGPPWLTRVLLYLARQEKFRRVCLASLLWLSQRATRKQMRRHRKIVLQREEQLDQQLAFFKRMYHESKGRF